MDLERTISNGVPAFWKGNRHGYTYNLDFAGIFTLQAAQQIVTHDLDNTTVMIHVDTIHRILGKELKAHEGS